MPFCSRCKEYRSRPYTCGWCKRKVCGCCSAKSRTTGKRYCISPSNDCFKSAVTAHRNQEVLP